MFWSPAIECRVQMILGNLPVALNTGCKTIFIDRCCKAVEGFNNVGWSDGSLDNSSLRRRWIERLRPLSTLILYGPIEKASPSTLVWTHWQASSEQDMSSHWDTVSEGKQRRQRSSCLGFEQQRKLTYCTKWCAARTQDRYLARGFGLCWKYSTRFKFVTAYCTSWHGRQITRVNSLSKECIAYKAEHCPCSKASEKLGCRGFGSIKPLISLTKWGPFTGNSASQYLTVYVYPSNLGYRTLHTVQYCTC